MIYRYPQALFWILVMPLGFYIILSLFKIEKFISLPTTYSEFLLPGLIALTIMQNGIYGLAYWLVDLRAQGVVKRFLVTPINPITLVLSVVTARTIIAFAQVLLLTLAGVIFFDVHVSLNIIPILFFVILGSLVFLLVGLFISTLAKSYDVAAPITALFGLPMTFLGGAFYPVESMPKALNIIAQILPITYFSHSLRTLFLNPFSLNDIWKDFLVLFAWLIFLLVLVSWRFKSESK